MAGDCADLEVFRVTLSCAVVRRRGVGSPFWEEVLVR